MSIIKLNNRAVKDATAVGSITGLGNLVFISRSTASSSASLSITSGINSTYKEYIFMFNNIHPATDDVFFTFNGTSDGSNFNVTKTTTTFGAYQNEAGNSTNLFYDTGDDLAQSTSYQNLVVDSVGNGNDESTSGILHLFDPSNTTFVKHFIARTNIYHDGDHTFDNYIAGYFNDTSAITGLDFKMSSGNTDSGTIDMYGVL